MARLVRAVEMRAEDFKKRHWCNKVRIVVLPEKVEERDPTEFMEHWLQEVFCKESFTPLYSVERAHRVPPWRLPPGRPPHTMLACLLIYKDKEIVLRKAREKRNILHNGVHISFTQTFQLRSSVAGPVSQMLKNGFNISRHHMLCCFQPGFVLLPGATSFF